MAPLKQVKATRGGLGGAKAVVASKKKAHMNDTIKKRPRKEEVVEEDEEEEEPEAEATAADSVEERAEDSGMAEENGDGDGVETPQEEHEDEHAEAEKEEEEEEAPPPKKRAKKAPVPKKPKATKPTKAKAKSSAKSPAKSPAKAKAEPKKRKIRTLEDKLRENAPLNEPFFEETGHEWHATVVDFEELSELRRMWELPAACHILWLLQTPLTLRVCNTLREYEAALLNPENSPLLEDVFTKLLLKKSERACLAPGIGLKYEWWNKQLREYYMALYDKWYALLRKAGEKTPASCLVDSEEETNSGEDSAEDKEEEERDVELSDDEWLALEILKSRLEGLGVECPLKHQSFSELSVVLRCKILLNLCEAVVDDPLNTDYIRQMEEDDLRVEPVGGDRVGNVFFYFPQFYNERRMYRFESESNKWQLWAKGDDAFTRMLTAMKQLRGRKGRGEQELLDHLEVIVEQIGDEAEQRAKQEEKLTKKAILEAIPRKRSMRIQVKQIEQMEKHKEDEETKRVFTLEEIAEIKRAELLRKVEHDAEREAREQQREAKRVAREEAEKEAALAERELRRQRRLEKEKEEEERELRAEEQRRQQEEARKLRAMQRLAAEQAEAEAEEEEEEEQEEQEDKENVVMEEAEKNAVDA